MALFYFTREMRSKRFGIVALFNLKSKIFILSLSKD